MADLRGGEGGEEAVVDVGSGGWSGRAPGAGAGEPAAQMSASGTFKGEGGKAGGLRRRASIKQSMETDDLINLLHGSDPVKVELNRLENDVRGGNALRIRWPSVHFLISWCFLFFSFPESCEFSDKERELGEAQAEIKALRLSERAREKAVEEVFFLISSVQMLKFFNLLLIIENISFCILSFLFVKMKNIRPALC